MNQNCEFDTKFSAAFDNLTESLHQKYGASFECYRKFVIPFQSRRMKQNQNLSFKNSSLEQDKMQLIENIEQLKSQNQKNQYVLQKQAMKINELERTLSQLQGINNQNLNLITALRLDIEDREAAINDKDKIIKQVSEDKNQILEKFQLKTNQYTALLANYMREKNQLADKVNENNQWEHILLEKQKEIKEKQFYLKKQWEEYEQAKKKNQVPEKSVIPNRTFNKGSRKSIFDEQEREEDKNQNYSRNQILRTPLKKIIKHHQNQIYDVEFNYNGNMLATCGGDHQIKIFDVLNLKSGVTINSNSVESIFLSVGLDYSGERLLAGSTDRTVQIFSTNTGKQLNSFVGHGYKINSVSWSSSKEKCVSGSEDKQIKVWDIEKNSNLLSITCGKPVKFVHCNTVQPVVYSGHSDGSVRIYSINQGNNPINQIRGVIDYPINSISLLSSRNHLLVSSTQGTVIHLLDLKMNKSIAKFDNRDFFNTSVRADISPSQKYIVAGNCDGAIYYWNKDKKNMQKKISGHESPITTLKYHFISSILATCDKDGGVILWQ